MFHDHKLNTLPNYTTIQWDNYGSFKNIGKYSQLIYFLKDLIPNKKICICTEFYDSNIINNSNMDLVVINVSDHPVRFASNLPLTKPIITLDYNARFICRWLEFILACSFWNDWWNILSCNNIIYPLSTYRSI